MDERSRWDASGGPLELRKPAALALGMLRDFVLFFKEGSGLEEIGLELAFVDVPTRPRLPATPLAFPGAERSRVATAVGIAELADAVGLAYASTQGLYIDAESLNLPYVPAGPMYRYRGSRPCLCTATEPLSKHRGR